MPTLRLLPELEDALRRIQGVKAASVVTGPDAVPTEVHVLAAPGKPAKLVVRDVQSLALARYDIDIDHRIVSVVQMGDDEVRVPDTVAGLAPGDESADESEPVVRPAIATLDAVAELLGQACEVESSTVVPTGSREVALTVLTMALPRIGEQVLTG